MDATTLRPGHDDEEDPDAAQHFNIEGHERTVTSEVEKVRTQKILEEANKIFGPLRCPPQYGKTGRSAKSRLETRKHEMRRMKHAASLNEQEDERTNSARSTSSTSRGQNVGASCRGNVARRPQREPQGRADERHRKTCGTAGDADEESEAHKKDISPEKTKREIHKGMTDAEMEGTEEAMIPRATQPLHNPFHIAPEHKQHKNSHNDLNKHMGVSARHRPHWGQRRGSSKSEAPRDYDNKLNAHKAYDSFHKNEFDLRTARRWRSPQL